MLLHFMELQSFATRFFQEAMIHSDASVDFTGDGSFLVTLVPSNLPMTTVVGVYGMSKATRGQVCDSDFQGIQLMKIEIIMHTAVAAWPPRQLCQSVFV